MTDKFEPKDHLIKVKGSDYLETRWRIAWFRSIHPEGLIETELVPSSQGIAIFKATAWKEAGGAHATGYGTCRFDQFDAPFEKAETRALGRALAALGFGIQFVGEEFSEELATQQPRQQNHVQPPSYEGRGGPQQVAGSSHGSNRQQGGRYSGGPHEAEEQVQQQYQQDQRQYQQPQYEPPPHDDRDMPQQQTPVGFGNAPRAGADAATTAQVNLVNLQLKRKLPPEDHGKAVAQYNHGDTDPNELTKRSASALIDYLKALPDLQGMGPSR